MECLKKRDMLMVIIVVMVDESNLSMMFQFRCGFYCLSPNDFTCCSVF